MQPLLLPLQFGGKTLHADLQKGYCLAIPLDHTKPQPNAYHAPFYDALPVKSGDWIGDTRLGASVNFFDIRINPHGNGTHTECVGHISKERYSIHQTLSYGRWIAQLISVYPVLTDNGDRIITDFEWDEGIEAIILRTMPNHPDKMTRQYSRTNPPFLHDAMAKKMADHHVTHLLIDLPSVDREEDGGALAAHKAFWQYPDKTRFNATITEMIYIDNMIPDGLYLLEIQIPAIELDAAPSRPYIYPMK